MTQDLNPLEALTEQMAKDYVELVLELVDEIAPVRPWWDVDLSPDEQLWRWLDVRDKILPWIMLAGANMGAKTSQDALGMIERVFTDAAAVDLIPPDVVAEVPTELLEMVQSGGARDAGNQIRKMERMVFARAGAIGILANTDQPAVPQTPGPTPTTLPGTTPGFPEYGGAAAYEAATAGPSA